MYKRQELGFEIGGFNAYISSDVLRGSGLSSSASIEVLLGTILSHLYNDGQVDVKLLAMVGQYAENVYLSLIHIYTGRLSDAKKYLEEALKINPNYQDAKQLLEDISGYI